MGAITNVKRPVHQDGVCFLIPNIFLLKWLQRYEGLYLCTTLNGRGEELSVEVKFEQLID